jgi:hypothetical protein
VIEIKHLYLKETAQKQKGAYFSSFLILYIYVSTYVSASWLLYFFKDNEIMSLCVALRLLERPVRGTRSQTDIPLPEQLVDKKKEPRRSNDSLVGKDKEIGQSKNESDSNTLLPGKRSIDRKKLKSDLERLEERHSLIQHEMPNIFSRNNKENGGKKSSELPEDLPESVKKQRKPSTGELEAESVTVSSSWKTVPESEKSLKASLQFSLAKRRGSSGERDSGVSEGSVSEGKQSFTSPLHPREDDSLLHGSSELMLVLLPETRNMQSERGNNIINSFHFLSLCQQQTFSTWWCLWGVCVAPTDSCPRH